MKIDMLSASYLLGSAQGIFLTLALLSYRRQRAAPANRYLLLFVFIFSLDLLDGFGEQSKLLKAVPHLIAVFWPLIFLYGPLIYFYTLTITQPNHQKKFYPHLIAMFMAILLTIPFYILPAADKIKMVFGEMDPQSVRPIHIIANQTVMTAIYISVFHPAVYLILCLKLLNQHRQRIEQSFSNLDKVSLNWLRNILIATSILWVFHFINIFFGDIGGFPVGTTSYVLIVILIYSLGLLGLKQPTIFQESEWLASPNPDHDNRNISKEKYEKSALDSSQSQMFAQELNKAMVERQLYLDNQLTLSGLASQMGWSTHYLSQVINEQFGKNFFEFINGLRIEEAINRLRQQSDDKINILNLAMMVGFNSKSAFYSAFKKITNMTPNQYRKSFKTTTG